MATPMTIDISRSLSQQLLWFREDPTESLNDVIARVVCEHLDHVPQEHPNFERATWASRELHMWMVMFIVDNYERTTSWVTRRAVAFGSPRKFAAITGIGVRRPSLTVEVRGTPEYFRDRRHWIRPAKQPGWSRFTFHQSDELAYAWGLVKQAHRLTNRLQTQSVAGSSPPLHMPVERGPGGEVL